MTSGIRKQSYIASFHAETHETKASIQKLKASDSSEIWYCVQCQWHYLERSRTTLLETVRFPGLTFDILISSKFSVSEVLLAFSDGEGLPRNTMQCQYQILQDNWTICQGTPNHIWWEDLSETSQMIFNIWWHGEGNKKRIVRNNNGLQKNICCSCDTLSMLPLCSGNN